MTVAHAGNLNTAMTGHDLADLARQYGTDKVPKCPIYERYFEILRDKDINFLEIGIGGYDNPNAGGESLRMWKAYFAKAHIYGLDFLTSAGTSKSALRSIAEARTIRPCFSVCPRTY